MLLREWLPISRSKDNYAVLTKRELVYSQQQQVSLPFLRII